MMPKDGDLEETKLFTDKNTIITFLQRLVLH